METITKAPHEELLAMIEKEKETGELLMEWMEDIDAEVEHRFEAQQEDGIDYLPEDERLTKEQLREQIWQDADWWNWEWEFFNESLDEKLRELNPEGYWVCVVANFGWLNKSGHQYVSLPSKKYGQTVEPNWGIEIIRKLLPETDCHFKIFRYKNGIAIRNWHHDSPMGNEWYYAIPITEEQYHECS